MSLRAVCGPSCPRCIDSGAHSTRTMKALPSMIRLRHALCSSTAVVGGSTGFGAQTITLVRGMALRARAKQSKDPDPDKPDKNSNSTTAQKVQSGTKMP